MRRDYSQKHYSNTLYQKKGKGSRIKKVIISIILAILILFYFVFFTNAFSIDTIEIVGNESISKDEIISIVNEYGNKRKFLFVKLNNILFFDKKEAEDIIREKIPLDMIKINKKLPHKLSIQIKEKIPYLVWIDDKKSYFMDSDGTIISLINQDKIEKESLKDFNILRHNIIYKKTPIIYNIITHENLSINSKPINDQKFNQLKNFLDSIKGYLKITINYFEFHEFDMYVTVVSAEGWKIFFSLNDDTEEQIKKLNIILENKMKVGKIIDYIDLRYGDKVFYK